MPANEQSTDRSHRIKEIVDHNLEPGIMHFLFANRDEAVTLRTNTVSPLMRIFANVPTRRQRPISSRPQESDATLLESTMAADSLLDISFVCEEAFLKLGQEFPTSIWSCCTRACFASLALGESLRFFALVRRFRQEIDHAKRHVRDSRNYVSRRTEGGLHPREAAQEALEALVRKQLSVLLGKKSFEGISGKLCVLAVRDVLGISLDTIYRKRGEPRGVRYTLVDASAGRQRMMRRVRDRSARTAFNLLNYFECSCVSPRLAEADPKSLESLYHKFAAISENPSPYAHENEFLIDLLYDPFLNSDIFFCDKAVAEVLDVGARRVMRARKVVKTLIRNPSLLLQGRIDPPHGMHRYASEHHPINRIPVQVRQAIAQGLDISLRADPAAADGRVSYRFYDPNVNTYEKIKQMLHRMMSETLGDSIGALSSTSFRRIFNEYMAERDGSLSFARADHNCCPHCQELELRLSVLEMEMKALEGNSSADTDLVARKQQQITDAKEAFEEHVGWDLKVRGHLRRLVSIFRRLEDEDNEEVMWDGISSHMDHEPGFVCPQWSSRKGRALLCHQDDMTKPNVPSFVQDSLSELARYRPDVTADVSAINGNAFVMSHELGSGQKNSGSIFEAVLLDHLLTCRGENLKIVWSDCAPVGRSFFLCVAAMQFLVDSGLCDLALSGYMANCHGKYLADSLFGQWSRRARNENITSVDGLLHVFEKINRSGSATATGIIINPVATVEWQENLARLGYATTPPAEFGWESMNPHYACACRQSAKESMNSDLISLLSPLMPDHENSVRITSWPRFTEPENRIPFEQRCIDVPAKQLRRRTEKEVSRGRPNDLEWHLCVPKARAFAESGPGVVPRSIAAKVGHNSSGFLAQVPLMRHSVALQNYSWPPDFTGPPHKPDELMKVAPENWVARRTVQRCSDTPTARYPPLNYYNALNKRPPREKTDNHKHEATYNEPPFPVLPGTCAYSAALRLASEFDGRIGDSVSVLDLYRAVRSEMDLERQEGLDEYLQPSAKPTNDEAHSLYLAVLREKKYRLKKRPLSKRNAFQIFRADDEASAEMVRILAEKKRSGETRATLASVSKQFWEAASDEYKKKYEDLVITEKDRVEREFVDYKEWLKERDEWLDEIGGVQNVQHQVSQ